MADDSINNLGGLSFEVTADTTDFKTNLNALKTQVAQFSKDISANPFVIKSDLSQINTQIDQLRQRLVSLQAAQQSTIDTKQYNLLAADIIEVNEVIDALITRSAELHQALDTQISLNVNTDAAQAKIGLLQESITQLEAFKTDTSAGNAGASIIDGRIANYREVIAELEALIPKSNVAQASATPNVNAGVVVTEANEANKAITDLQVTAAKPIEVNVSPGNLEAATQATIELTAAEKERSAQLEKINAPIAPIELVVSDESVIAAQAQVTTLLTLLNDLRNEKATIQLSGGDVQAVNAQIAETESSLLRLGVDPIQIRTNVDGSQAMTEIAAIRERLIELNELSINPTLSITQLTAFGNEIDLLTAKLQRLENGQLSTVNIPINTAQIEAAQAELEQLSAYLVHLNGVTATINVKGGNTTNVLNEITGIEDRIAILNQTPGVVQVDITQLKTAEGALGTFDASLAATAQKAETASGTITASLEGISAASKSITSPTESLNTDGIVSGAQQATAALNELRAAASAAIEVNIDPGKLANATAATQALNESEKSQLTTLNQIALALENQATFKLDTSLAGKSLTEIQAQIKTLDAALDKEVDPAILNGLTAQIKDCNTAIDLLETASKEFGVALTEAVAEANGSMQLLQVNAQATGVAIGQIQISPEVAESIGRIPTSISGIARAASGAASEIGGLGGTLAGLATGFAAFFAVQKILEWVAAIAQVAPKVGGIEEAYAALGLQANSLDKLRDQTKGLVSDLDLEKDAVKFTDFNLPVDQLGKLLAFASEQAQATGKSIDEMSDKIVDGLSGRGVFSFKELNVSSGEFKEALDSTGTRVDALVSIIDKRIGIDAVEDIQNLGTLTQRTKVFFDNLNKSIGEFLDAQVSGVDVSKISAYIQALQKQAGDFQSLTADARSQVLERFTGELNVAKAGFAKAQADFAKLSIFDKYDPENTEKAAIEGRIEQFKELQKALGDTITKYTNLNQTINSKAAALGSIDDIDAQIKTAQNSLNALGDNTDANDAERQELITRIANLNVMKGELDGSTELAAAKKSEEAQTRANTKAEEDYTKAAKDSADIIQTLTNKQQELNAAQLSDNDKKLAEINVYYDTQEQKLKDLATAQNKAIDLNTKLSQPQQTNLQQGVSDQLTKGISLAENDRATALAEQNATAQEAAAKEIAATQISIDQDVLNKRKKLYQDEASFETNFGQAAAQANFGIQTSSFVDFRNFLQEQLNQLAAPVGEGNATADQVAKYAAYTKELEELDQSSIDKRKNIEQELIGNDNSIQAQLLAIDKKAAAARTAINNELSAGKITPTDATDQNAGVDHASTVAKINVEVKAATQSAAELGRAFSQTGSDLQAISPKAAVFFTSLGKGFSAAVSGAKSLGPLLQTALNPPKAGITSGDFVGDIVSVASTALNVISNTIIGIVSSAKEATAELNQFNANQITGELAYKTLVIQTAEAQAESDTNHLASIREAAALNVKNTASLQAQYDAVYKTVQNAPIITGEHSYFDLRNLKTQISQDTDSTIHSFADLQEALTKGDIQGDQNIANVKELVDLNNQITASKEQQVQLDQAAEEANLGQSLSTISSTIDTQFENSLSSVQNFGDTVEQIVRRSLIAGFEAEFLQPIIDKMTTTINDDIKSNTSAAQIQNDVAGFGAQIAALQPQLTALLAPLGLLLDASGAGAPTTPTSITADAQSLTEQTGDLIAGRLNAFVINQNAQIDLAQQNVQILNAISVNTFDSAQGIAFIASNMVMSGQANQDFTRTVRAGGTFI